MNLAEWMYQVDSLVKTIEGVTVGCTVELIKVIVMLVIKSM